MKKHITILFFIIIMATTLAGCRSKGTENDNKEENNPPVNVEDGSNENKSAAAPTEAGTSINSDPKKATDSNNALLQGFEAWEASEGIQALNRVLLFREKITDATPVNETGKEATRKEYYLNDLDTFLDYQFNTKLIPDQYAIVDLDQDGTPEVVVSLLSGEDGWIDVLRYYDGTVYGYSFVLRGFEAPKTDGTYLASSGAMDNYFMSLSFEGSVIHENCLGYTTFSGDEIKYYIGNEKVSEQEYGAFSDKYYKAQDVTWHLFQSNIRAGYVGQELLRLDFKAKTHAQVQTNAEYYSDMENQVVYSHSSQIPEALCELILDAMEHGTEQETLPPLMVDKEISQEEFLRETGLVPDMTETVQPVRVDGDNDGIKDLIGQCYSGGTGGFSSMKFYQGSADGQYTLTNSFECFLQDFGFLQYQGKQYLLMKDFDYNTKYDSGYTLYLYEDGKLADSKSFSYAIDDYDRSVVYEDTSFEAISSVKTTLGNKKLPEILFQNDGVINGTSETIDSENPNYQYSCDIDNDGKPEYYNKSMWYPSNLGTVMSCMYSFENSGILDDLCSRLSEEQGNGRLYTFWLDKVNGQNVLYLYYGDNLDYSLYAYLISKGV